MVMTQIQPILPLFKWIPSIKVQHDFMVTREVYTVLQIYYLFVNMTGM